MSDDHIEALVREAEIGYDVSTGTPRVPRHVDVLDTFEITGRGMVFVTTEPDPVYLVNELVMIDDQPYRVKGIERHAIAGGPRPGRPCGLLAVPEEPWHG